MIHLEITLLIFFAISIALKSRTFFVLALFAWINIYVDKFTTEDDLYLMLTYATVDFICAISILYFGDIQKLYQSSLLAAMILAHTLMEIVLVNDYVSLIESNTYLNTITVLLILQMLGGMYGTDRIYYPLHRSYFDRRSIGFSGVSNHKTSGFFGKD